MEDIILPVAQIVVLLFSIVIHEVAHGSVAYAMGDSTAKLAGRLTLNPIKHIDPVGSILVPMLMFVMQTGFIFGWAKPVPINPYNFKDQKYGQAKSAFAGPAANLIVAIVFGLIIRAIATFQVAVSEGLVVILTFIVIINIVLAIFNLLPIPPLDGSHILFTFLPPAAQNVRMFLHRYGFFILILFVFLGGFSMVFPLINFIFTLITGFSLPA